MISNSICEKIQAIAARKEREVVFTNIPASIFPEGENTILPDERIHQELITVINHEVRTSMNAIMGFAQVINIDDISKEVRKSCSEVICKESEHLIEIFNQIIGILNVVKDNYIK